MSVLMRRHLSYKGAKYSIPAMYFLPARFSRKYSLHKGISPYELFPLWAYRALVIWSIIVQLWLTVWYYQTYFSCSADFLWMWSKLTYFCAFHASSAESFWIFTIKMSLKYICKCRICLNMIKEISVRKTCHVMSRWDLAAVDGQYWIRGVALRALYSIYIYQTCSFRKYLVR